MTYTELENLLESLEKFDKDYCSPTKPLRNLQHEVVAFQQLVKKAMREQVKNGIE